VGFKCAFRTALSPKLPSQEGLDKVTDALVLRIVARSSPILWLMISLPSDEVLFWIEHDRRSNTKK
jgi:hypothetical protein